MAREAMEDVIVADLEIIDKLPYDVGYFVVIIFADVPEHITDPWSALKYFKKYLADDDEIIVRVPNVANFKIRAQLLFGKFKYQEYVV
jgi:hypothetical protein